MKDRFQEGRNPLWQNIRPYRVTFIGTPSVITLTNRYEDDHVSSIVGGNRDLPPGTGGSFKYVTPSKYTNGVADLEVPREDLNVWLGDLEGQGFTME
jgi:hypothetical protein